MRLTPPPFPPEHGSWALLACAIVIGSGAGPSPTAVTTALLALAAFAANMGRGALAAAVRRRADPHAASWLWLWGVAAAASVLGLIVEFGDYRLLWLMLPAGLIVVGHVGMGRIKATRRFDRTLVGELLGALGIGLLAPGAYFAAGGSKWEAAGLVWLAAAVQSVSGILHVRAILGSLRSRKAAAEGREGQRGLLALGSRLSALASSVYHGGLAMTLIAAWRLTAARNGLGPMQGLDPAALGALVTAYAPLIVRSAFGLRSRSVAPRFTRVGILETALSLWCAGWTAQALRIAG